MVETSFWIMLTVYAGLVVAGYILASRQIKVVKLEEYAHIDRAKSFFFGVFFASGVVLLISMMVVVIAPVGTVPLAEFIQFDLWVILGFITGYPVIDLLYLAHAEKEEGQTPYHRLLINKILSRFTKPKSYVVALFLYFGIFVIPIGLLKLLTGLPWVIIWLSWIIGVPIVLLMYYASRGYVAGISNVYFHLPPIQRSLFLGFENGVRMRENFKEFLGPTFVFGFMLFTYIWQYINLTQTVAFIITGHLTINTAAFQGMALVVLFFGIVGFFTRFWGRKIKFTTVDLLLSSWIMMGIGADVLVNFLIANQTALSYTFANSFFSALAAGADSKSLAFAASVDKIVLIVAISYYFLSKKNPFARNTIKAMLARARETLDPVPLFNFVRSSSPEIKNLAESALVEVYDRLPKKRQRDFFRAHFMNPLMDAICDPHPNVRRVGRMLFANITQNSPQKMLRWIQQGLASPNYEKKLPVAQVLLEQVPPEVARQVKPYLINTLVGDPNWQMRVIGLRLLTRFSEFFPETYPLTSVLPAVDDGDYDVQAEALLAINKGNVPTWAPRVVTKMSHSNEHIRRAAALAVAKIGLDNLDATAGPVLIEMMQDSRASSRVAAFEAIQKIGKISEYHIPIAPIIEALCDPDAIVRKAATMAILAICDIEPYKVDVDALIAKLEESSPGEKLAILPILGKLWKSFPQKILPQIFTCMAEGDAELKSQCSGILKEIGKEEPLQVAQHLITLPETSGLLTKGIISRTLIDIGRIHPEIIITFMNEKIQTTDPQQRLTAASVLEELGPAYPDQVDFEVLSAAWASSSEVKEKKQIAKLISEVIQKDPHLGAQGIDFLIAGLADSDPSVRISMAKTLKIVSETAPDIVPLQPVKDGLKDHDPLIQETMIRIIGNVGYRLPDQALIIILDALSADNWMIRDAAADSLGRIAKAEATQKMVIASLVKRLDDKDKWVRYKVMLAIGGMLEQNPDAVPLKSLITFLLDDDDKVREATIKAIGKIGQKDFNKTHTYLAPLMADKAANVRDACIGAYFDLSSKVGISIMLPKLLMLLSDETDIETQRIVAQILRRVAKYEKSDIRTRIIKLLRIRCEMSQDTTICRVLSEFEQV